MEAKYIIEYSDFPGQKVLSKFEKGYKRNWTKEIFVVDEVNKTIPITYKIKDLEGEPILGSFYKEELSKTKF